MKTCVLQKVKEALSVEEAASAWHAEVTKVMEACIPRVNITSKPGKSWINSELVKLLREKQKKYQKFRKTDSLDHKRQYLTLKKKLRKEIFLAKKHHFQTAFSRCRNSQDFWSTLNRLSGRKHKNETPVFLNVQNIPVVDDKDKAESLVEQFASVFG
jgi:hypothetical protein